MKRFKNTDKVTVFHGSKNKFHDFDSSFLVNGHDQTGPGLYTTTDQKEAKGYGPHKHVIELNTEKFVHPDMPVNKAIVASLVKNSPYETWDNWDENEHLGKKKMLDSFNSQENMHSALESVWYDAYKGDNKSFIDNVAKHYHGTLIKTPTSKHYLIWNKDAISTIKHEKD